MRKRRLIFQKYLIFKWTKSLPNKLIFQHYNFEKKEVIENMRKTILGSSRHVNLLFTAVASLIFTVLTANISASEPSLDKVTSSSSLFKESVIGKDNDRGDSATRVKVQENYGKLPLYFVENQGQINEMVKFYEQGNGHTTFFTKRGIYLSLAGATPRVYPDKSDTRVSRPQAFLEKKEIKDRVGGVSEGNIPTRSAKSATIRFVPLGANSNPEITAEGLQECKVNYLMGNDSEKWKTNIPTYKSVVYKGIYKNVDMRFYGNNRQLEYDIIINPGASPSRIQLLCDGVEDLRITGEGDLEISLKEGNLIQKKPYVYQEIDGKRKEIEGRFIISNHRASSVEVSKNTDTKNGYGQRFIYGFQVASYDKEKPLIIDPVLAYSTYLGGNSFDAGYGIAVDTSGNAYVTGFTGSTDFPTTPGAYDTSFNGGSSLGGDAFVTKLNPTGTALTYSTYLGGSSTDKGYGIAVDTSGNAYVTGWTESPNFPTQSPIQGAKGGYYDAFVTKINSSGDALVYSTYLGGDSYDWGYCIAVDTSDNVYVTGETASTNFPTQDAYDTTCGTDGNCNWDGSYYYTDAFVTKINSSGSALVYSTYLGGSREDVGEGGIAVDTSGNVYVTGDTESPDFPTQSPFQGSFGGILDTFVTKINSSGSSLVYSTYLGGSHSDECLGMAVDTSGNVYVTGETASTDFPTQIPIQGSIGSSLDAFVTKIASAVPPAPTVSSTSPSNGATGVAINSTITATFSEAMQASTITTDTFTVGGVAGTVTYDSGSKTATFTPSSNLSYSTIYTAIITTGVKNLAGNAMAANYTWTFTTSQCVGDGVVNAVETDTGDFELLKPASKVVTVTVTDGDGCPVADVKVSAKINAAGKKRIGISPSSKTTDENGKAAFTITAKKKTGKAKVTFKAGGIKEKITVTVK